MTARIDDTLSYVTPPINTQKSPSLLASICKKIGNFVKSIFNFLCFWKHSTLDLSQKKIELMNKTAHPSTKKHFSNDTHHGDTAEITKKHVSVIKPDAQKIPKTKVGKVAAEPKVFDDSLEGLRKLVKDSVNLAADAVYDKKIASFLTDVEKGSKFIPELLKLFSRPGHRHVGDDSLPSILHLFSKSPQSDLIDPAYKHLLQWLKNAKNQEEFAAKLKRLKEEFSKLAFPSSQSLDTYMQPILDWLFKSDHSTKIESLFPGSHFDHKMALNIFKSSLKLLTKNKIDSYDKLFLNTLQNNLPEIIQSSLKTNSLKVTDTLFVLMGELI